MVSGKSDEIIIDGRDLLTSIRIGVKMPRMFGLRMTIATWLFKLAGLVSGLNVFVEADDDEL
uniref:Putative membrane protein n=1 Tax=biofilter metagenome TaxID=1070537 RepID=A0A1A7GCZ4_9ZZZZ